MNMLPTVIVIAAGLLAALWWAVMPAREAPGATAPNGAAVTQQCPQGSHADGKRCVCDTGSQWTGSACATPTDDVQHPDTRHVTTVDLRRR